MRTKYLAASTIAQVREHLVRLGPKTAVFDVEPLVALWDTDQVALRRGLSAVLDAVGGTGIGTVVFATNSRRTPPSVPTGDGVRISYLALAGKPLRTAAYRGLPLPGVVVGDQIATDGLLAWRLGYPFLHYVPSPSTIPWGPRLMAGLGRAIRPLIFTE